MAIQQGIADVDLYAYNPSATAAWAFVVLWGIGGLLHFVLMFPHRAACFIPLIVGCVAEAGGYYFRTQSHDHVRQILPFVLQGLLILTAPPFLAATIYMSLGRIIRALKAESYSIISPRWLTKLFVLVDLVCLGTQLAGSILRASDDPAQSNTGSTVVLAGLILQAAVFVFFVLTVLVLHVRLHRQPTAVSMNSGLRWERSLGALYALSVVFVVRNIVRIAEFEQGGDGFIDTHEAMLYIFDGGVMLTVVGVLAVMHPCKLVKKARKVVKDWNAENEMGLLM